MIIFFIFASPKILTSDYEYKNYFDYLKKYYIDGLKYINQKITKKTKIFIPSTIYLSKNIEKFTNYVKAKKSSWGFIAKIKIN